MIHSQALIARALSTAFLAGGLDIDESVDRGSRLLGKRWSWLHPLAQRVSEALGNGARPRQVVVTEFILRDQGFLQAFERHDLQLLDQLAAPDTMFPLAAAQSWTLPAIRTPGELAEWLNINLPELDWFADLRGLQFKQSKLRLRHYHYRPLAKRFGQTRMVEAPKPRLKEIQRRILAEILDEIPAHVAAHGFRRGRSITTFAAPHVGRRVVMRIDLENFFPSISSAQVQALFRTVGYPERVADLLAALCTNATPFDAWEGIATPPAQGRTDRIPRLYARRHLPQGAPTSPALANLCAFRLDCRLNGLARSADALYTRYADDLAFSGDANFARVVKRFHLHACAIAIEEGHAVHHRKTRIMRHGVRQRLAGVVVNEHLNVSRIDYDRLKATLTNCVRHGAASQNRASHENFRAHLLGRVSFVEMVNPMRGRRLRKLFDQVKW